MEITIFIIIIIFFLLIKKHFDYKNLYDRFKDIIDIEKEIKNADKKLKETQEQLEINIKKSEDMLLQIQKKHKQEENILKQLLDKKQQLEDDLNTFDCGLYNPHFDFDTSERYKQKIVENNNKQKILINSKNNNKAIVCHSEWILEGSKSKGRAMTNKNMKLMLRAFNNECDSLLSKVKWNNVEQIEKRIKNSFDSLNKFGENSHIQITNAYLNLKLEELYLAYEYQNKLQEEKEEQRRIREQIREEEKVQREIEKAQKTAEKEAEHYEKALEQARQEMANIKEEELAVYNEKMQLLEQQLKEALERKERALAQAQLTKSGHVYVISNIGSFGEDIYKIGMTRRLEPMDRVKELGDASVPFTFDVHAMIYSENAPELENILHKHFNHKRLNMVNNRKEFFNITLNEIKQIVEKNHGNIEFTKIAEAKEYRETLAIKQNVNDTANKVL